jgi:hypothetical protein
MALEAQVWTQQLSGTSLTITSDYGLTIISILCTSGTITVTGSATVYGLASQSVTLSSGQGITLTNGGGSTAILTGIIINATSGVAALAGKS